MSSLATADVSDLLRLNRNLKEYARVRSKMSVQEILANRGQRLRIFLYRAFWAQRWKQGRKGGGFKLLKSLVAAGKGIHVRLMTLVSPWAGQIPTVTKRGQPLNERQKLVAQEMIRRSAGVGILGVSFLRKRWRETKVSKFLVENRTKGFGKAVTFALTEGQFTITGWTPGLKRVAEKYGLLGKAVRNMNADTEVYLSRKLGPEFLKSLHAP
jgi:hypothetical protein